MNFLSNLSLPTWIASLLSNDKFFLPFYATVSAAITLLLLQFVTRLVKDSRKKLYAVAYTLDVCYRMQASSFILLRHTILPHIAATKRILAGEEKLLDTMFEADEFDILTAGPIPYRHVPEEYKVLLGYDDIELVQMIEAISYLSESDTNRLNLNLFVKENLKSRHGFFSLDEDKKKDVLNTYWDHLSSLEHEETRLIAFLSTIVIPRLKSYIEKPKFLLFSTRASKKAISKLEDGQVANEDLMPSSDFIESTRTGGIQRAL